MFTGQAIWTIAVAIGVFATLALTKISTDIVLVSALALLLLSGVLSASEALAGFANEGLATIAFLFVVAAGLRETGVSSLWVQHLLGKAKTLRGALVRLMAPTAFVSAFLNNTPIVALLMPVVHDWARRNGYSPSKFLIPLSYAAILGGVCTLIGTSTNLVVNGLMMQSGYEGLHIFEIAKLGLPCALIGLALITILGPKLLPDRRAAAGTLASAREYTTEMIVEPGSALDGKSIQDAGLRSLQGAYLVEINRSGQILPAVGPNEKLRGSDQLVFVGIVESMVDLQRIPGLQPASEQLFQLDAPRPERVLVEAVVSKSCPLLGQTIRDSRFRTFYDAVIIAVSRDGQRLAVKIGDIVLQPGDTLLLEASPSFMDHRRNSRDFYLVSHVDELSPPRFERRWVAIAILGLMTGAATFELLPMFQAAFLAAGLMILTKTCSQEVARRSIDGSLLVSIGAAFGLGKALQVSGAADAIAGNLIALAAGNPYIALAAVYLVTTVFTEIITNNAAAAVVFPIAAATAVKLGVNPMPFFMSIMIAASASFATPIGYQTNLMVYGPGGYRFNDFLRMGILLNLTMGVVAVLLAPMIWPF